MKKASSVIKKVSGTILVEVVLALAIFGMIVTSLVIAIVNGRDGIAMAGNYERAIVLAEQGLEALRAIRDSDFAALSDGSFGLRVNGDKWELFGGQDVSDNLTRKVTISTIDPNTKEATLEVSWTRFLQLPGKVTINTRLTNWRQPKPVSGTPNGGTLVYESRGGIFTKTLDQSGNFGAETGTAALHPSNPGAELVEIFSSPTRNEKVILSKNYNGSTQFMFGQVFNGSSWGHVQMLSSRNSDSNLNVRNLAGGYLANGDFMVVYSDFTNFPKFRIWDGANWSEAKSMPHLGAVPLWIAFKARPGTNEVMVGFFDSQLDTNTMYFNGGQYITNNWTLHGEHSRLSPWIDKNMLDFAWSSNNSSTGALAYTDQLLDMSLNIKLWNANNSGSGIWSGTARTSIWSLILGAISVASRRGGNEFIACDQGATVVGLFQFRTRVTCFKSDFGPNWSYPGNLIIAERNNLVFDRFYDLAYEAQSGASAIVVYFDDADRSILKLKRYNSANVGIWDPNPINLDQLESNVSSVKLVPKENSDDIMILSADNQPKLYSEVWDGANDTIYTQPAGKARTSHQILPATGSSFSYDFAWDIYAP